MGARGLGQGQPRSDEHGGNDLVPRALAQTKLGAPTPCRRSSAPAVPSTQEPHASLEPVNRQACGAAHAREPGCNGSRGSRQAARFCGARNGPWVARLHQAEAAVADVRGAIASSIARAQTRSRLPISVPQVRVRDTNCEPSPWAPGATTCRATLRRQRVVLGAALLSLLCLWGQARSPRRQQPPRADWSRNGGLKRCVGGRRCVQRRQTLHQRPSGQSQARYAMCAPRTRRGGGGGPLPAPLDGVSAPTQSGATNTPLAQKSPVIRDTDTTTSGSVLQGFVTPIFTKLCWPPPFGRRPLRPAGARGSAQSKLKCAPHSLARHPHSRRVVAFVFVCVRCATVVWHPADAQVALRHREASGGCSLDERRRIGAAPARQVRVPCSDSTEQPP